MSTGVCNVIVGGVCLVEEQDKPCAIADFLESMDQYRQDDLDVFDESHMDAGACIGSGLVKYRKLMAEQSTDRQNKTKRFKSAVSELQKDFQVSQAELAQSKRHLEEMTNELKMAVMKNVN